MKCHPLEKGYGLTRRGLVKTNLEAEKRLYLKAFPEPSKIALTKARFLKHDLHFHGRHGKIAQRRSLAIAHCRGCIAANVFSKDDLCPFPSQEKLPIAGDLDRKIQKRRKTDPVA